MKRISPDRSVPAISPEASGGLTFHGVLSLLLLTAWIFLGSVAAAQGMPKEYSAQWVDDPPTIDGVLEESVWQGVAWSESFIDIEGAAKPTPTWDTRFKIVWDEHYLYLAARLEEPHLWATLTDRDAVIYHDNDFEWFIDPDDDTNRYFELEINALGTVWDLFLDKPYRKGGKADNSWDIVGLRSAVHLDGTLNDPTDLDGGWTVEMAVPWEAFSDGGRTVIPPSVGTRWRLNFSRVQWDLDAVAGGYRKAKSADGEPLPEHNWVWSPQGEINMHIPERWGWLIFTGGIGGL